MTHLYQAHAFVRRADATLCMGNLPLLARSACPCDCRAPLGIVGWLPTPARGHRPRTLRCFTSLLLRSPSAMRRIAGSRLCSTVASQHSRGARRDFRHEGNLRGNLRRKCVESENTRTIQSEQCQCLCKEPILTFFLLEFFSCIGAYGLQSSVWRSRLAGRARPRSRPPGKQRFPNPAFDAFGVAYVRLLVSCNVIAS